MVDYLLALAVSFLSAYPGFGTFLMIVGGLRVAIKPIMTLLQSIADYTPFETDNKILVTVLESPIYKGFIYLMDYLTSLKFPKAQERLK